MITQKQVLEILTFATRAPSTHNSQPWLFKLDLPNILISYDPKLLLPQADTEGRDLYISMGCMIENLSITARHFGFEAKIEIALDEIANSVARVTFLEKNDASNPLNEQLFKTIPSRVNARGVFEKDPVPAALKQKLTDLSKDFASQNISVSLTDEKEKITKIAQITERAMHFAYANKNFRKEMSHWMNSNLSNKKEGLPGYSLKMPLVVSMIIPMLIRFCNIGKFLGKLNLKSLSSAPMLLVIDGPNTKNTWIAVGRLAERLMLMIQSEKFQTSIYVGSIEMGELYKEVQSILGSSDRPQFIFATGIIKGTHKMTPRHPIEEKIIS